MKRAIAFAAIVGFAFAACDGSFHFDEPPQTDAGPVDDAASPTEAGVEAGGFSCTNDPACGNGLRCDLDTGLCVACLGDTDCSSPLPRCDTTRHICVGCLNGPDCAHRQACDTVTNRCLNLCTDADDCTTAGFVCDDDRALCIECKTAANCAGSAYGPLCNATIGRCVQCIGDADCSAPLGMCDRRTGKCAACVASSSCPNGQYCDPTKLVCRAVGG